jgi:hypothetical protein
MFSIASNPSVHGVQVRSDDPAQEPDAGAAAADEAEASAEEHRQRQTLVEEAMHAQMDMQKQLQTQLEASC